MKENKYEKISKRYRQEGKGFLSEDEVDAYLAGRMPATRAAILAALEQVAPWVGALESLLDVGAGPGTGYLSACEVLPIEEAYLVEENSAMAMKGPQEGVRWIHRRAQEAEFPKVDLALFGYSFGEISDLEVLKRAWEACEVLVVVEPGTPRGFQTILRVRRALAEWGGFLVAPCPHQERCPMEGSEMWCHFSARVQRTREHRQIKGGSLGWEDEKYSYVAFSKEDRGRCDARIVHVPNKKEKGVVTLGLCKEEGLAERRVSKREGALYKRARKAKWGDLFSEEVVEDGEE